MLVHPHDALGVVQQPRRTKGGSLRSALPAAPIEFSASLLPKVWNLDALGVCPSGPDTRSGALIGSLRGFALGSLGNAAGDVRLGGSVAFHWRIRRHRLLG